MQVSFVFDNFYPKIGGMSIQNQEMTRFLHKTGVAVKVFPLSGDDTVDYSHFPYQVEPIYVTRSFPQNYGRLNIYSIAREILKVLNGILKIKQICSCSIVHTDLYASGLLGSIIRKLKKKHLVINFGGNVFRNREFSSQGEDKYHKYKGLVYTIGAKIALSMADKIIVNGEDIVDELTSHGVPSEKIKVIYVGIDVEKFRPDVSTRNIERYFSERNIVIPKERKIVMLCGRLVNANGPFGFLEVIDNLGSEVVGMFVGDGPLKKKLEEEARKIRNPTIFTGAVEHELMPEILRLADLCIYPFVKIGGISQVVLEAMACGKCVITTNAGAMVNAVKNGYNGFIANVGDIKKMIYYANTVLKDDHLRDRMGERARQDVLRKWSWAKKIEEYLGVCEEVLRGN